MMARVGQPESLKSAKKIDSKVYSFRIKFWWEKADGLMSKRAKALGVF